MRALFLAVHRGGPSLGPRHAQEPIAVVTPFQAARLNPTGTVADLMGSDRGEQHLVDEGPLLIGACNQQPAKRFEDLHRAREADLPWGQALRQSRLGRCFAHQIVAE